MKGWYNKLLVLLLILSTLFNPLKSSGQQFDSIEIDSLKNLLISVDVDDIKNIDLHIEIAKSYRNLNLDSLLYYSSKAISLSEEAVYIKGLARSLYYKADYFNKTEKYDRSLELLYESIELYGKIPKDIDYLHAVNLAGIIYELRHDYDMALELYMKGLKDAQALENKRYEAFFYNNISIIYDFTGLAAKRLEYVKKASALFKELGETYYYSYTLVNTGLYYMMLGENDSAMNYFNEAKPILLKDKNYYGLTNLYSNLGIIHKNEGKIEAALSHYKLSLQYAESIDTLDVDRRYSIANANLNLAHHYLQEKEYSKSLYHYRITYSMAEKNKSLYQLQESSEGLLKVFLYLNQKDSVLYYYEFANDYSDSLLAETYNEKIDNLDYDFHLSQEKVALENEKKLFILNQQKKELLYLTLAGILLALAIISVLVWLLQRNKLRNIKLRNTAMNLEAENLQLEIDAKNRKLTTFALNLIERNEFIANLSEKIKDSSLQDAKDNGKTINEMIREIDLANVNQLWEEFEKRFIEVHADFYQKLSKLNPTLTSNDRKLCAFILLNMSIKDISSITYQSPHSIKIARYRLRKKLGLEKNENLNSFLHNL
jgi:tetratricopeptide (TPR) repeat protein